MTGNVHDPKKVQHTLRVRMDKLCILYWSCDCIHGLWKHTPRRYATTAPELSVCYHYARMWLITQLHVVPTGNANDEMTVFRVDASDPHTYCSVGCLGVVASRPFLKKMENGDRFRVVQMRQNFGYFVCIRASSSKLPPATFISSLRNLSVIRNFHSRNREKNGRHTYTSANLI